MRKREKSRLPWLYNIADWMEIHIERLLWAGDNSMQGSLQCSKPSSKDFLWMDFCASTLVYGNQHTNLQKRAIARHVTCWSCDLHLWLF